MQSVLYLNEPLLGTCATGICRISEGDKTMRGLKRLFAAVVIMAVAAALGGCLHGHHAKQATHKPMKLGAADTVIEMVVRV
jgi:hypothetical protein